MTPAVRRIASCLVQLLKNVGKNYVLSMACLTVANASLIRSYLLSRMCFKNEGRPWHRSVLGVRL